MKTFTVGIIGNGRFGNLLREIVPIIFPESNSIVLTRESNPTQLSECDLVIPAVPIRNFEEVIQKIASYLKKTAIVMDVCSVKVYPTTVMKKHLPPSVSVIGSHPMFGPGTYKKMKGSCSGLTWVLDPVRIAKQDYSVIKESLEKAGLSVKEIDAETHDRYSADFHFTAQFMASVLKKLDIQKTPIDTMSVLFLHEFIEVVQSDSLELLKDMCTYNEYCKNQLSRITNVVSDINTLLTK